MHQPRHLSEPVRLFGPSYLEVRILYHPLTSRSQNHSSSSQVFTRTKWFVIPTIWLPIATYLGLRSILQFSGPLPPLTSNPYLPLAALLSLPASAYLKTGACILIGNVVWTILEYTLHRFLFHVDYYLPDTPMFLTLHFLLHGIHHYLPMDRCVDLFPLASSHTTDGRLLTLKPG